MQCTPVKELGQENGCQDKLLQLRPGEMGPGEMDTVCNSIDAGDNLANCKKAPPTVTSRECACFTRAEQNCQMYELFRQALVEGSAVAWEKIYTKYWRLVLSWVQQESSFAMSGEEGQDFANRAFEKMWRSITPTKFAKFGNLAVILKYLRLCVRSVVIDEARRKQRRWLDIDAVTDTPLFAGADIAQEYCEAFQRDKFWSHIQTHLKNPKEAQLIYYRFVLGLKPNRICEQYRDTFANPAEVYTMLQNILARLRRDPALQEFTLC